MSKSVAEFVNVSVVPSLTVLLEMAASVGAPLASPTVMVITSKSFSAGEPLSVTRTVKVFVLGPCASVGVQVNAPAVVMLAPDGTAPSSV